MRKLFIFLISLNFFALSFSMKIEKNYICDDYGNKIVAKKYEKIVITDAGIIEILFEIGGEKNIAAIAKPIRSKIYPEEKIYKLDVIGDVVNINLEKIIKYKPDLIILNPMMTKNTEAIKKLGYDVLVSDASKLEDILDIIKCAGIITGQEKNADDLLEKSKEKLNEIKKWAKDNEKNKIKGTIFFSTAPFTSFSLDSLPGDILKHLGVYNIADGVKGNRPILSPEYILKENPDFLAGAMSIDNPEQILKASNVIEKTKAGKNKNIFILDSAVILRSSYRIFDELEKLKEKLEKIKNN